MPRQRTSDQFDLFSTPHTSGSATTPQWQALPSDTRQTLTCLMGRLIRDHLDGARAVPREEADHEA
jgi:hypothetical protein